MTYKESFQGVYIWPDSKVLIHEYDGMYTSIQIWLAQIYFHRPWDSATGFSLSLNRLRPLKNHLGFIMTVKKPKYSCNCVKHLLAKYSKRPLGILTKIQKMEIIKEITCLIILPEKDKCPHTQAQQHHKASNSKEDPN